MGVVRRAWGWVDHRIGFTDAILPIIEHPVPRKVNWWYVFGSATLVAFIVQVVTGVALAFSYVPAPNSAYATLEFITHDATLGYVVRGIHYWGASAMILLISIHTARVFMMGSYKYPREFNWLTGVVLLLLTLAMAFTGQLLRWDQDAYWAVVVAAEQAGRAPLVGHWLARILVAGQTVGGATLTRFYATHVFLLPAIMFLLIGSHLYLVVRKGISEPPEPGKLVDPETYDEEYEEILKKDGIPFWPDAAWRDVVFALAVGAVVVALAIFLGPKELAAQADPTNVNAYPRPDWYFLSYFALLSLIPPSIEDWVIIGFPLLAGILLFAVPFISNKGERSPSRRPWTIAIVGVVAVSLVVLVRVGDDAPWSPNLNPGPLPVAVTQGLNPAESHGADLFHSSGCVNCHLVDGVGGKRGPNLTQVSNRLNRDQMIWRVLNGGTNMPAYGRSMQPDDLSDLVDFLQSLK
jgi:ubiquinol-cytochrome c reductase cytochrome b subunit